MFSELIPGSPELACGIRDGLPEEESMKLSSDGTSMSRQRVWGRYSTGNNKQIFVRVNLKVVTHYLNGCRVLCS